MKACPKCTAVFEVRAANDLLAAMNCIDCPYCGCHMCGTLQTQAGHPCIKKANATARPLFNIDLYDHDDEGVTGQTPLFAAP